MTSTESAEFIMYVCHGCQMQRIVQQLLAEAVLTIMHLVMRFRAPLGSC